MKGSTLAAVPAAERFKPLLRLEPAGPESTPVIMRGTLHPLRLLEGSEGPRLRWYERMLPAKFRSGFASQPGLEAHAVKHADELPEPQRSPAWERLLGWQRRYKTLSLEQKASLLMLNNKLVLNHDNARLLADDSPRLGRRWGEAEAHYAYQRAFNPYMVRENLQRTPPLALARVFEKAPPGTRIRFMSANKFIVLSFELDRLTPEVERARAACRDAVDAFKDSMSPCEAKVWESKYWRADTYFPDKAGDVKALERSMDKLRTTAGEAVRLAAKDGPEDPFLFHFAEENAHAAAATLGIIHMHHRRWEKALDHFTWLVREDPIGFWQRLARGRMLLELARLEEAYAELTTGMSLAVVGRELGAKLLARCCEGLGRADEARVWRERENG